MRWFVPDQFKGPGNYWARQGTKREAKRRSERCRRIFSEAKPGNSHFIIFPSSMAIPEDRVRPGERHSGPQTPSAAETPSEQVKNVGGELVNQHPDDYIYRCPSNQGPEQLTLSAAGSGA
jgi:hypothetical protein